MRPAALRPALAVAVVACLAAGSPTAAEIGVAHLVFEKSAKMKKIEASLFLSFRADEERQLLCGVMARGRNGSIPVAGSLGLRLVGESDSGREIWQSAKVDRALDDGGDAVFEVRDLLELAAEATMASARPQLLRVDFRGGRGGKASELTLDCLYESVGP